MRCAKIIHPRGVEREREKAENQMRGNRTTSHFFYGGHLIKLNKITFFSTPKNKEEERKT